MDTRYLNWQQISEAITCTLVLYLFRIPIHTRSSVVENFNWFYCMTFQSTYSTVCNETRTNVHPKITTTAKNSLWTSSYSPSSSSKAAFIVLRYINRPYLTLTIIFCPTKCSSIIPLMRSFCCRFAFQLFHMWSICIADAIFVTLKSRVFYIVHWHL